MLGDTLELIAAEKAGIMKPGVPVITGAQTPEVLSVLAAHATKTGAELRAAEQFWRITPSAQGCTFSQPGTELPLPPPSLLGQHQYDNAGIAVAAILASGLPIRHHAIARGIATAAWPARLQRLTGHLAALLPADWELWLDGGHNPGAGEMLATFLPQWRDRPLHLVVGMKKAKDSREFLRPLLPHARTLWAVAEPGQHLALPIEDIIAASGDVAHAGPTTEAVLRRLAADRTPSRVLICGSLYLAGEILKADGAELT
jgi:dihydrofolate synthase/folylpolyglutamate synthase